MNVPKLRFKEFSDEWQHDKICNVTTYVDYRGKTPNKTETGIFLVTAKNVKKGYIDYDCSKEYVAEIEYEEIMHRGKPKVGDVLITTEAPCGNVAQIDKENIALAQRVIKYRGNALIDNTFLKYEFLSNYFQNELKKVTSGGTVSGVKGSILHNMEIHYCSKEEQLMLSSFLTLLDKKIELQTKKIEDLKLYKKGLLMNLFKDRTCNKKLSQCFSFGKAGGTPKSTNQDYYNGNIPFLSISDMSEQGKYIFKTEKSITELGINNSSAWLVPKNSIIISMYASYGLVSINNIELSTSQAMFNIIITEDNSVEYIYYYLYYLYITNFYDSIVSTGTQPNLNAEQLKNLKIYIPPKAEQEKMSNKLIKFENKLNLEILKLTKLQELKKGLMQSMFV